MMGEHSSKQYDMDLETIRSRVLQMGGLVESQFQDAIRSFKEGDRELAQQVINGDEQVNRLEVVLDDTCNHLIVKRQPAAIDLRMVMSTVKVITDLERIGDEAVKIARIAANAGERHNTMGKQFDFVRVIATRAAELLHEALDAFARKDEKQATELIAKDAVIDHEYAIIMRSLLTYMMEDPRTISSAIDTMWVAKAIERVGDHATNIAEYVIYVVEGKDIRHSDYGIAKTE